MSPDKPNIPNIVHHYIPKSLEGYFQEISHAGRNDFAKTCLVYLYTKDITTTEKPSRAANRTFQSVERIRQ